MILSLKSFIMNNKILSKITLDVINYKVALTQRLKNADDLKRIKALKNTNRCSRCFIIGTGPSLRIEDLELLKNEITFAPNRVYELFDKTDWRPTYYVNQDHNLIQTFTDKIMSVEAEKIFIPVDYKDKFVGDKYNFFVLKHKDFYPNAAPFSRDISKYLAQGFTVIYGAIQIAIYMGYTEIYILGVDHNYQITRDANGNVLRNDSDKENYATGMQNYVNQSNLPRVEETTIAFETVEKLSKRLGVKIYNCTRGGKLDAFERKNLDDVLEELL